VSKAFKAYVGHPAFTEFPYAELDYSSPLCEKTKSYDVKVGFFASIQCFIMLCDGTAVTAEGADIYHHDLNNCESSLFTAGVPARQNLIGHTAPVTAICDFKKNIIISSSEDWKMRVWNLENNTCIKILEGHKAAVTGLVKLNDTLIASTSLDKTIRVWDIEQGKCIKIMLDQNQASPIKAIVKLPDENSFLTLTSDGISHWNAETNQRQYRELPNICSIHLLSDDQLILHCEQYFVVTAISSMFQGAPINSTNSVQVRCPTDWIIRKICALPNGNIAFLSAKDFLIFKQLEPILQIHSLEEGRTVFAPLMYSHGAASLALLADQRIAVCGSELKIFSFALENKELVQQKDPELSLT
jgi:WD40 repeat protein